MDGKVGQRGHIDRLQSAEDLDDLGYILKTIWNLFYDNMKNKFCLNFEIFDQNRDVIDHFKPNFDFFSTLMVHLELWFSVITIY